MAIPFSLGVSFAASASAGLDDGYRAMYNLEFDAAHRTFAAYARAHPEDPLAPASDAAAWLFAEFDRLHILQSEFFLHDENFRRERHLTPDEHVAREFERQLAHADDLAERRLRAAPNDSDALLASVLVLGLRSDYDGLIAEHYLSSLNSTRRSRKLAERLLAVHPDCSDAWVAIGVENYLLSLKPVAVRWFVQMMGNSADREYGLAKLRLVAEHGHYLRPFAELLLVVADLRAGHRDLARTRLARLATEYPHNRLYTEELARLR